MKPYTEIIKSTLIAFLIGGILILWGYKVDGTVRIILGILIIVIFTKNGIYNLKYILELRKWKTQNNRKLIFFYPTRKDLQVEIEKKIVPLLPKDTLKVYYEGPSLVGDIKRSIIKDLMNQYTEIEVNSPSIFKFIDNKIYIQKLPELNDINTINFDSISVKTKVDQLAYA